MQAEMDVHPIPCLSDNYAYLLVCPKTRSGRECVLGQRHVRKYGLPDA